MRVAARPTPSPTPTATGSIYQLAGATGGTAALSPDGRTVLFTPTPGSSGAAGFTVTADDGFGASGPAFVPIQVSTAPLLAVDIANRGLHLARGERSELAVVGDFADQQGVPLLGNYVTYATSNGGVLSVDASGVLHGLADGYAAVTVRRGHLTAATAVTVGAPADPLRLGVTGLFVYPEALTLPEVGGLRQFLVQAGDTDLSAATAGTTYIVADATVVAITPDGLVTSAGLGETTVTIINGPAEKVVPVMVDPTGDRDGDHRQPQEALSSRPAARSCRSPPVVAARGRDGLARDLAERPGRAGVRPDIRCRRAPSSWTSAAPNSPCRRRSWCRSARSITPATRCTSSRRRPSPAATDRPRTSGC